MLCKRCKYFVPNGGHTSFEVIYEGHGKPSLLGNCICPIEPNYGRLKNELNGCDNGKSEDEED